jgi:hypothetical protein
MFPGHFKREAKIMLWFFLALVLLGLLGGVVLPHFVK